MPFISREKDSPENGMDACLMAMSRISTPGWKALRQPLVSKRASGQEIAQAY